MTYEPTNYDKPNLVLDWGGSTCAGTYILGTVSYSVQWLLPVLDLVEEGDYVDIPDFGGGIAKMEAKDVTADGLIMVGYGHNKRGPLAFHADMTDPLLPILKTITIQDALTLQTLQWTKAEAVSADGTIIAGYGGDQEGKPRLCHHCS